MFLQFVLGIVDFANPGVEGYVDVVVLRPHVVRGVLQRRYDAEKKNHDLST